ncbi:MAG TPA: BlaI/MecI/CopY family transcriptional regulator [Pyrinomonadaceae bacterium]
MAKHSEIHLSRREREIMEIIYQRGQATAAEVMEQLHDPPGYSAVRALLRILEEKGALRHEQQGPRYVFLPTVTHEKARRSALKRMVEVFFNGSTEATVATLLDMTHARLTPDEWERLGKLIERSRKKG